MIRKIKWFIGIIQMSMEFIVETIRLMVVALAKEIGCPVGVACGLWIVSIPFSVIYYTWLRMSSKFLKNETGNKSRKELDDFADYIVELYQEEA